MDEAGLSRKEKLALWRATRKAPDSGAGERTGAGAGAGAGGKGKGKGKGVDSGVLAARPGAANGVKRAAPRVSKCPPQRKPFQVDARSIHAASERRVQPGTPIHSLKKRLKRTAGASKPPPTAPGESGAAGLGASAAATSQETAGAARGATASIPTARAQGKAKASAAARVPGHVNGVSRSLDSARTKEVSDYLKSQISEANMLREISGVDAARTLLADLLPCTAAARGVGELALYWAARAKLEEDAGMYLEARQLLDEGEAYISMPTQQKVMAKVMAAFEGRMNERAAADVDRLLEDSVDDLSLNDSAAISNSPTSSAPFRYDPNDLSLEDDSGNADSAIKNLNFSKIARGSSGSSIAGGSSASKSSSSTTTTTTRMGVSPEWMRDEVDGEESTVAMASPLRSGSGLSSLGSTSNGGIASMSGVIYSDDDSDLSVSDIDEGVIARANAFAEEEEARKARMAVEDASRADNTAVESASGEGELKPVSDDHAEYVVAREDEGELEVAHDPALGGKAAMNEINGRDNSSRSNNSNGSNNITCGISSTSSMAMAPPPPQSATIAAAAVSREPRTRKGTPHPKPKPQAKRTTPTRGRVASEELSPGSFVAQVEGMGKDGKRTLTPVRRSRRISSVYKEATPAILRREMEAML